MLTAGWEGSKMLALLPKTSTDEPRRGEPLSLQSRRQDFFRVSRSLARCLDGNGGTLSAPLIWFLSKSTNTTFFRTKPDKPTRRELAICVYSGRHIEAVMDKAL